MKIKFFVTPIYPYGDDHYYHEIIVLAEGFLELGYEIFGNVNYWQDFKSKEYLIKKSEDDDYDMAIYDYRYVKSFDHLLFRDGFPNFNLDSINILPNYPPKSWALNQNNNIRDNGKTFIFNFIFYFSRVVVV